MQVTIVGENIYIFVTLIALAPENRNIHFINPEHVTFLIKTFYLTTCKQKFKIIKDCIL